MRVIAYTRVSTEEQAKGGHSLDQQERAAAAYCEAHGHELVDVVSDRGVSAGKAFELRPGGAELMRRIAAGQCEGIVTLRLDRMFRDALDGLTFFQWLRRQGAAMHSIHDRVDTSGAHGKFHLTMLLATAQLERDLTAERATECSTALRERGKAWGPTPYGCTRVGDTIYRGHTWLYREHLVALREDGLSLRAIVQQLRESDIPSPNGSRRWSVSSVRRVLESHDDIKRIARLPTSTEAAASEEVRA